jgi:Type II CAAX prenyl endopeptidase Rce1-like
MLWAEVGAVLAVGVVPNLVASVSILVQPPALLPYWLDALQLIVMSGCTIFVTLYLIYRSGETWKRFGLLRPQFADLALGMVLFIVAVSLWFFCCGLLPYGGEAYSWPQAQQPVDYLLMVLKYAASAFAEELVTRAYLVARFQQLLRFRGIAVLLSAALFASYHAYQGAAAVMYTLAFGIVYGIVFLLIPRVWPLSIGHASYNVCCELLR